MGLRGRVSTFLGYLAGGPVLAARGLIQVYRHSVAALIGFNCRHLPTCSTYADEAVGRFGLWAGGWMTLARLCRCHPLGTSGLDFVPASLPDRARWYLPSSSTSCKATPLGRLVMYFAFSRRNWLIRAPTPPCNSVFSRWYSRTDP